MTTATETIPNNSTPLIDFVAAQRMALGWVMVLIGLISLGFGLYLTSKVFSDSPAETQVEGEATPPNAMAFHDPEETLLMIVCFMGAVVGFGVGAQMLVGLPSESIELKRTSARLSVLAAGGLFGVVLIVGGLAFFVYHFEVVTQWVNSKTAPQDAWKVITALLAFLCGAGLAFVAAQPARAEERNSPTLRRLIYGTNFALGIILLAVVLIVGNIVAALKLPQKLDTTASGFYTLDPATVQYVKELREPIKITSLIQRRDERLSQDTLRLIAAIESANPSKVRVRNLVPSLNRKEIDALQEKFPNTLTRSTALLITNQDETRATSISLADLVDERQTGPQSVSQSFQGEAVLARELLALSENQTKPIVYVTVGHGELDIVQTSPTPARPATTLAKTLDQAYVELRPLVFELGSPKVPEDAAIVIVADPRTAFRPEEVAALDQFMTAGGKAIILAGPSPNVDGSGIIATGLEQFLGQHGVLLGQEYLYMDANAFPGQGIGFRDILARTNPRISEPSLPIVQQFMETALILPVCQTVNPGESSTFQVDSLLQVPEGVPTWLETSPLENPGQRYAAIRGDKNLQRSLRYSGFPHSLAVGVYEGERRSNGGLWEWQRLRRRWPSRSVEYAG